MRFPWGLVGAVLGLVLVGCDTTPDDPLLPTHATFRLIDTTNNEAVFAEVLGDADLRQPDAVISDTLSLVRGRRYQGRLEFYNSAGDNITYALQEHAEVIEVVYGVAGVPPVLITPTDTEATYGANHDGIDQPVGLAFEIDVAPQTPNYVLGTLTVQVLEYYPRTKGASSETTYWSHFSIPLAVGRPGPRQPSPIQRITGLNLRLEADGRGTSIGFSDADGLHDGIPYTLSSLSLESYTTYAGTLRLDGIVGSGAERELTSTIREEGVWYLVEYEYLNADMLLFQELNVLDVDVDGQPLGLLFELRAFGAGRIRFDLGIKVYAYAVDASKLDAAPDRTLLVDVAIPIDIL